MKSYSELMSIESFTERLKYLRTYSDNPSNEDRVVMNRFYKSREWREFCKEIKKRDFACDMGIPFLVIEGPIFVHHINPISVEDVLNHSDKLLDPENVICVSMHTHNTIHYDTQPAYEYVERTPGDTKLW